MIGTSFQSVGVDNTISVQDIKASGLTGFDWTFETEAGDTLMIWDASSQMYLTTLYYTGDEYDENGIMEMFGAAPGTWFDMDAGATADMSLENGDAFWVISSVNGAKVTIAGEVPTTSNGVNMVPGYNMIANPYPKAVSVNELFTVSGLTGFDWTFETDAGDTLMIWDPSTQMYQITLYYTGDEYDENGIMEMFGATPGTWFDMDAGATATTEIPAGGAFWIVSSGNGTLTFK
ncbi:MAG: hypothetical protein J6V41_05515 [Kiritimatiellae bacterium]|nr:hypothetical protein [Kiritimatiellia bacterium]